MPVMPLQTRQISEKFSESKVDNAIRGQMDGGYTITRPRYTRKQLRKFGTGFAWLTQAELDTFMTFYDTVETWGSFDWTHPISSVTYTVRFEEPPVVSYAGRGGYDVYDVDIKLAQI